MTEAQRPSLKDPAVLLATWFGSGFFPVAPGTAGSLAALPCGAALAYLGGPWLLLAGILLVTLAGIWSAGRYNELSGKHDSGAIVIDEVTGQWIALLWLPLDPLLYAIAFVAFRFFDILKPYPANWADRKIEGGLGVMADDLVAGLYALIVVKACEIYVL